MTLQTDELTETQDPAGPCVLHLFSQHHSYTGETSDVSVRLRLVDLMNRPDEGTMSLRSATTGVLGTEGELAAGELLIFKERVVFGWADEAAELEEQRRAFADLEPAQTVPRRVILWVPPFRLQGTIQANPEADVGWAIGHLRSSFFVLGDAEATYDRDGTILCRGETLAVQGAHLHAGAPDPEA